MAFVYGRFGSQGSGVAKVISGFTVNMSLFQNIVSTEPKTSDSRLRIEIKIIQVTQWYARKAIFEPCGKSRRIAQQRALSTSTRRTSNCVTTIGQDTGPYAEDSGRQLLLDSIKKAHGIRLNDGYRLVVPCSGDAQCSCVGTQLSSQPVAARATLYFNIHLCSSAMLAYYGFAKSTSTKYHTHGQRTGRGQSPPLFAVGC